MEATDTSIEAAAESLLAPTNPETDEPETEEEEADPTDEAPEEADADADEDEAEGEDDVEGDADEDSDTDDEEDAEGAGPEELTDDTPVTVPVAGKDVATTLGDLKRSFSGQAYIQQKMQENAEAKKQIEGVYQQLQEERAKLSDFFEQVQTGNLTQEPTPPDRAMLDKDPIGYMQKWGEYQEAKQAYDQQQAQFREVAEQQEQAQQAIQRQQLAQEAERLKAAIPEIADPEKGTRLKQAMAETARKAGYSDEEVAQVFDHRAILILDKARRWDELQASKGKAKKKAQGARPVVKPGARPKTNPDQAAREKARQRFTKEKSVDAAVELLLKGN